jgi:hypothetical protein
VQAADVQLGKILVNNQVFVIPHFQRPYVWKQEDNWEPLWADVRQAAEEVEVELAQGAAQQDPRTYFLGAIVTQDRWRQPQRLPSMHVIDGQQRLTTLQVLLAAARAVALARGHDATAGRLDGMLENPEKAVHEKHPSDRQKLVPLPQDQAGFAWAVRRGAPGETVLGDHRLVQARIWFERTIGAWATEGANPADRLDALQFALEERVQLVHIALHARDDAQVIFEALNYRGTRLNPADLIKNLLFQTVEQQGEQARADDLLMKHWLVFDSSPWRDDMTSGRITRARVDVFIAHWLTMRAGSEVSVEHLFTDFKRWLQSSKANAGDVIEELRRFGTTYLRLLELPTNTATGRLVDSMQATNTNTPWPVLLHLHGRADIPASERERAAAAIDSFLMRRAICGMTSKDYNNLMRSVLSDLQSAPPEEAGVAVEARLAKETAPSRVWPGDEWFRRDLLAPGLYQRVIRGRLRALLVGLDNKLTTGMSESDAVRRASDGGLTVEHLLPQKWQGHWGLDEATPEAEAAREEAVHRLGNLTLLTAKLNPAVSNRAWASKRAEIQKHSLLRLTSSSVLTAPPTADEELTDDAWAAVWDELRIMTRGLWLADQAVAAWPRPSGGPEEAKDGALSASTRDASTRGFYDISIADLIAADKLSVGDELVWMRPRAGEEHRCVVLADGQLHHPGGQVSATPSGACATVTDGGSFDGWECWRVPSRGNVLINELRSELREAQAEAATMAG